MLKVLVVDDEFIVRMGLISCIRWEEMDLELVGEASNGLEAMEMIRKHMPDIILLDLLMPGMTGMDLIQKLEEQNIRTNIIILSCHEDYSYVRDAFKKGVRDYILKLSSTPEEICSVLGDVAKKILAERASSQAAPALLEVPELDSLKAPKEMVSDEYYAITFYGASSTKEVRSLLLLLITQWLMEHPVSCLHPCLVNGSEPILLYTGFSKTSESEALEHSLAESMEKLHRFLSSCMDVSILVGISSRCPCTMALNKALHESQKSMDALFYDNSGCIGIYSNLEKLYHNEDTRIGAAFYRNIGEIIRHQHFQSLTEQIAAYTLWVLKEKPDPRIVKLDTIDLINTLGNYLKEKKLTLADMAEEYLYFYQDIAQMRSFLELKSYLDSFIQTYMALLQSKGYKNIRNDVLAAANFIEEHYSNDISLSDVARYINISKNHLSYLFKKETGQTFSDYLIQYRIAKARSLLESGQNYTVSEIAELTGFHDTGYFSKVFKKATGLSPNQYKKGN